MEFYPEAVGFLNYMNGPITTGQTFIGSSLRVVVFFKDRKPIVTYSVLNPAQVQNSTLEEVTTYVQKLYDENNDILATLNSFPYMGLNVMDQKKSNALLNIFSDL